MKLSTVDQLWIVNERARIEGRRLIRVFRLRLLGLKLKRIFARAEKITIAEHVRRHPWPRMSRAERMIMDDP